MCDSKDVTDALQRCPFLSRINREKGPSYAGNIATRPAQPADRLGCPFKNAGDALAGFSASFELFHGDRGVLPLHRGSPAQSCPVQQGSQEASAGQHRVAPGSMPVAAISLSGFRFLVSFICAMHTALECMTSAMQQCWHRSWHPHLHYALPTAHNVHVSLCCVAWI